MEILKIIGVFIFAIALTIVGIFVMCPIIWVMAFLMYFCTIALILQAIKEKKSPSKWFDLSDK